MNCCGYKFTELGELKIYNRTIRSALCLSGPEQVVLLFILDRTIGWRKLWETISPSQFVNGVIRRKRGRDIFVGSGTHLTSDQLNEALMRLRERGAIEIERRGGKVAYKINEYWCHPDLEELGMWEITEGDYDYEEDTGGAKPPRPTE